MIVGAGNAYVAEAKRQLFGRVGIDLLAGPTEVLVIADATADPELVAADLLGQAEHGPTSPGGAGHDLARGWRGGARAEVERCCATWPDRARSPAPPGATTAGSRSSRATRRGHRARRPIRARAPRGAGRPRPSSTATSPACATTARCSSATQATVAYGDKAVGTNHVLPTAGAARYTGGLWVGKFLKTCTYQRLTEEGTRRVAPAARRSRRPSVRRATRSRRACGWSAGAPAPWTGA